VELSFEVTDHFSMFLCGKKLKINQTNNKI
jgi:hypothetical protein